MLVSFLQVASCLCAMNIVQKESVNYNHQQQQHLHHHQHRCLTDERTKNFLVSLQLFVDSTITPNPLSSSIITFQGGVCAGEDIRSEAISIHLLPSFEWWFVWQSTQPSLEPIIITSSSLKRQSAKVEISWWFFFLFNIKNDSLQLCSRLTDCTNYTQIGGQWLWINGRLLSLTAHAVRSCAWFLAFDLLHSFFFALFLRPLYKHSFISLDNSRSPERNERKGNDCKSHCNQNEFHFPFSQVSVTNLNKRGQKSNFMKKSWIKHLKNWSSTKLVKYFIK